MTPPPDETEPQTPPPAEGAAAAPARAEVYTPSSETDPSKAKKPGKKDKPEPTTALGKFWVWVKPILKVIVVVWLVRTAIIDWNDVPTGSMEPNILVGDRILVNKMAYAFQLPLSGPKIGIPFTQYQWDNPLDFLPQLQWGRPSRGENVTFWNPSSGVRMVKRIVAEPGDTIEMRGGVMIINGTEATYTDVTPFPPATTKLFTRGNAGQSGLGSQSIVVPLEFMEENILGETRKIQHMREMKGLGISPRWIEDLEIAVFADGTLAQLNQGQILMDASGRTLSPEQFAQQAGTSYTLIRVREGATFVDGTPASFNEYAHAYFAPIAGKPVTLSDGTTLEIRGHELLVDGEPTSHEFFEVELDHEFPGFSSRGLEVLTKAQINTPAGQLCVRTTHLAQVMLTNFGPVTLGDDEYFMIGDNRQNSHDSRYFGPVKRGEITGEAVAIAASFDGRILQLPPEPRWSRWFKDLD